MHGKGTDRKVRPVPFYPTHGRARPGPPPPPVFFKRAFSKVKTPKRASRDGAAVRGAAPRGPTCTALRDLPTNTPPAGRSGLAEHLAPTRRPVRPPQGRFGRVRGWAEADFGPASPLGGGEVRGAPAVTRGTGLSQQIRTRLISGFEFHPPELAAPLSERWDGPCARAASSRYIAGFEVRPMHCLRPVPSRPCLLVDRPARVDFLVAAG